MKRGERVLGTLVTVWLAAANVPIRVAEVPFSGREIPAEQTVLYERNVRLALRRYGLPVDTIDESRQRAGDEAVDRCGQAPDGCTALKGAYRAVVRGEFEHSDKGLTGRLTVVDTTNATSLAAEDVSAPDARAFLDALVDASGRLAATSAEGLHLEFQPDAPLRGVAVYPFVAGGVLLVSGTVFLIKAASDSGTLTGNTPSLNEAVQAKNSGSASLTTGLILTGLGVASTIVGIVFYAPGAERRPLVTVGAEPSRGMLLVRGDLP